MSHTLQEPAWECAATPRICLYNSKDAPKRIPIPSFQIQDISSECVADGLGEGGEASA